MSVPGMNILNMALRVIQRQQITYYAFDYRATNDIGLDVAYYQPPFAFSGSVQPVPRSLYEVQGLDLQKNYYNIFVERSVLDISRDVSGDQIKFGNMQLQCLSKTAWHAVDGWDQILCIEVPTCILMIKPDNPCYCPAADA